MATNTLNTRLQVKHDTLTNWLANDPILLAGEIAVAYLESNANTSGSGVDSTGLTPPAVAMKVGAATGDKKFSELEWIQAVAGDVYSWAKAATKPTYKASEIQELESFIAGEIQDTNTIYKIEDASTDENYVYNLFSKEIDGEWSATPVSVITVHKDTLVSGSANGTVAFNGADVAVTGLKSAAYTEASAYATAAQGALADSALQKADITEGSANGTIAVEGANVAVHGLGSAAFTEASAYDSAGDAAAAQSAAQAYADGLNTTMSGRVDALESIDHSVYAKTADISSALDLANSALQKADITSGSANGTIAVEGSDVAVAGLGSAAYENTSAFDAAGAAEAVLGTASDAATANTVYGAKAAAAAAQTSANSANQKIDAFLADADTSANAVDTLVEIQEFLSGEDGTVQSLLDSVSDNAAAIEDVIDGTTTVAKASNAATADVANDLSAALDAEIAKIASDEADAAEAAAKAYADGLAGNYATAAQGALADTALQPADITTGNANGTIAVEGTDVAVKGLGSAAYTDASAYDAKDTAANLVNSLNGNATATAASGNVYTVLTGVSQTNGSIAKASEVTLAAVAKTGNVNDLVQTEGDYLILNCGTSSTVI